MIHFRNKTDIVNWLEKNCPRRAIVRALREGQVELLGGFNMIPPSNYKGWIIKVTSKFNLKLWYVAILATRPLEIRILRRAPWIDWVGSWSNQSVMQGDHPGRYKLCKHEAKKRMADRQ